MKKSFLKNLMIVSFAFAALFLIGNNVFAEGDPDDHAPPEDGGVGNSAICYSTYTPVPYVGEFWRCGDCVRVQGINKSDPGRCYFN